MSIVLIQSQQGPVPVDVPNDGCNNTTIVNIINDINKLQ